jgi:hypothetical protein
MTDRKATFAKRQREMEQKDNGGGGGPVIDWSAAHQQGSSGPDDAPADSGGIQPTPGRSEDSAGTPPGGARDD